MDLAEEEIAELLGDGGRCSPLRASTCTGPGNWSANSPPARRSVPPTTAGPGRSDRADGPSVPVADALLRLRLWFALGDRRLTREELTGWRGETAPSRTLRDQWVLSIRGNWPARARQDRKITPIDALGAALTGSVEVDGGRIEVRPTGWPPALRDRLAAPEAQEPSSSPPRSPPHCGDYQRRA
ncbi:hypothetical protein GCM10023238_23140 [Streptomyces heliomycini]